MKRYFFLFFICFLSSACDALEKGKNMDYQQFDASQHFRPKLSLARIDTLKGWDYCWEVAAPILKFLGNNGDADISKMKRLSSGQKALYFFWNLDSEVAGGGFVQYYWNGNEYQVLPLQSGLNLIHNQPLSNLVATAHSEYLKNRGIFDKSKQRKDLKGLYGHLPQMRPLRAQYDSLQNQSVELMEVYIRAHQGDFFVGDK
ncbi:MAG: DUF4375 domain-containing protein [Bacteroidia bacterium]